MAELKPILVVEDERDAREFLQMYGFVVICAENGQAALDEIASSELLPSLILLDLMMPVMDGDTFLKLVRQDRRLRNTPIILTTAYPPENSPGTTAILVKPIRPERLVALIRQALGDN